MLLAHHPSVNSASTKPYHYEIGCVQNRVIYDYAFLPKDAAEAKARRDRRPKYRYFGKDCESLIKRDGL